jgi:uncharacterized protein
MASRKNRRRNANRRSPKSATSLRSRFSRRYREFAAWLTAHRWRGLALGLGLLFAVGVLSGYWAAGRFESSDADRVAREAIASMKQEAAQAAAAPSAPKYASIDQIPGLPHYAESDPGQPQPTHEEKPRQPPKVQMASSATTAPSDATTLSWRRNALPFPDLNSRPLVTIVIDDVGLDRPHSKRAWELPGPLTMSFLPYAKELQDQAKAARAHGQELMLHLPMEPTGRADPGPGALTVSMSEADLTQRTTKALDSFEGYVGVNNHMGSRFTAYRPGMEIVLRLFRVRGLMFLDSRTTAQTVGDQLAQELGVPGLVRNVFLDDDESIDAVRRRLVETEAVARRQGFVVAIGHPHEATLQALGEWLPGLAAKGLALAPATAALRKRNGWD